MNAQSKSAPKHDSNKKAHEGKTVYQVTRMYYSVPSLAFAILTVAAGIAPQSVFAQGCVVTRGAGMSSEHFSMESLLEPETAPAPFAVTAAYRSLQSGRHFVGTHEQHERQAEGSQVINNSDFLDIALTYSFNPRTSATVTFPLVRHDRSQVVRANDAQRTILQRFSTQSDGLGDVRVTGNMWLRNPQQRPRSNLLVGLGFDAPTGKKDVEDEFDIFNASAGRIEKRRRTVDQSIQPGDGGWGLLVDLFGYVRLTQRSLVYANGFYTLTPQEKSGVATFRSNPFEAEMSISDSYLARAGVEYAAPVPLIDELTLSLGARIEGVPVRDLIGGSDGFRRPGYAVSIEPGVAAHFGNWSANLYAPFAIRRDRQRSVPDMQWSASSGVFRAGDAAFADYTVMLSVTRQFGGARSGN
jgi:hypothetical protein